MRLENTHNDYSSFMNYPEINGITIVDCFELLGTPENRELRPYERVEEIYRTLDNIRRLYNTSLTNFYPDYNDGNRFAME